MSKNLQMIIFRTIMPEKRFNTLKKNYSGAEAWFLTSHMEGLKHVGLRASRKIEIFQAKLECRFVKYEMYMGTKKVKSTKD